MDNYNLNKLITIRYNKARPSFYWSYYPIKETIFFGLITTRDAGFSCLFSENKTLPPNHYLHTDGKIWIEDRVILFFQNDFKKVYHFEGKDEALEFVESIKLRIGKWI